MGQRIRLVNPIFLCYSIITYWKCPVCSINKKRMIFPWCAIRVLSWAVEIQPVLPIVLPPSGNVFLLSAVSSSALSCQQFCWQLSAHDCYPLWATYEHQLLFNAWYLLPSLRRERQEVGLNRHSCRWMISLIMRNRIARACNQRRSDGGFPEPSFALRQRILWRWCSRWNMMIGRRQPQREEWSRPRASCFLSFGMYVGIWGFSSLL